MRGWVAGAGAHGGRSNSSLSRHSRERARSRVRRRFERMALRSTQHLKAGAGLPCRMQAGAECCLREGCLAACDSSAAPAPAAPGSAAVPPQQCPLPRYWRPRWVAPRRALVTNPARTVFFVPNVGLGGVRKKYERRRSEQPERPEHRMPRAPAPAPPQVTCLCAYSPAARAVRISLTATSQSAAAFSTSMVFHSPFS